MEGGWRGGWTRGWGWGGDGEEVAGVEGVLGDGGGDGGEGDRGAETRKSGGGSVPCFTTFARNSAVIRQSLTMLGLPPPEVGKDPMEALCQALEAKHNNKPT